MSLTVSPHRTSKPWHDSALRVQSDHQSLANQYKLCHLAHGPMRGIKAALDRLQSFAVQRVVSLILIALLLLGSVSVLL